MTDTSERKWIGPPSSEDHNYGFPSLNELKRKHPLDRLKERYTMGVGQNVAWVKLFTDGFLIAHIDLVKRELHLTYWAGPQDIRFLKTWIEEYSHA